MTRAEAAGPKLVAADPVVVQTRNLTDKAGPTAIDLASLLSTFNDTGGFQHLMDFIYNTSGNINGYDTYGHFQRALGIRSNCTDIDSVVFPSCEAFFVRSASNATSPRAARAKQAPKSKLEPSAPAEPLPPVEEVIPELDPEDEEPTETTPTEPADPSEEPDPSDQENPEASVSGDRSRTSATGGDAVTMQEASMLLQFLLGGSS